MMHDGGTARKDMREGDVPLMTDVRTEACRQVLRITCHEQRASADTFRRLESGCEKIVGGKQQVRLRLADSLRYIVSQRLAPRIDGGRQLLLEVMGHNLRTRETIALGESENRSFYEIIEASSAFGWTTFDSSILKAFEAGSISEETARLFSSKQGRVTRGIDLIHKQRAVSRISVMPDCGSSVSTSAFR